MAKANRYRFGDWPSGFGPNEAASELKIEATFWAPNTGLLWHEYRDNRGIIAGPSGDENTPRDLVKPHNVRARVGYGGGAFAASQNALYFVAADGRIRHSDRATGQEKILTPALGWAASIAPSASDQWLLYVHHDGHDDCIAICQTDSRSHTPSPIKLISGADFYLHPTWSPCERRLAWIEWDHPKMPWDGSRLVCADISFPHGAAVIDRKSYRLIAGGEHHAVQQPTFSPDGKYIHYLSDESGFLNFARYDFATDRCVAVTNEECEFAGPPWIQGARTYALSRDGSRIYAIANRGGFQEMVKITLDSGEIAPLDGLSAYTFFDSPSISPEGDTLAFIASSAAIPPRVLTWKDLSTPAIVRRSPVESICAASAIPSYRTETLSWRTKDNTEIFALIHLPNNETFQSPGQPPAVIVLHGGPSAQSQAGYNPRTRFLTSRGYVVLEVNYRGSSGYGRAYLQQLAGQWGVIDVEDAVSARSFLIDNNLADPKAIALLGGSAGGYTLLRTVIDYPSHFAAGVCLYGVANLFTLAEDTHKFEAHYLDSLVGTLPQDAARYRERSPSFFADKITTPLAIFQGADDKVVPQAQSEEIVASLARRGIRHEYHLYPDEGHGFRRPDTIADYYTALEVFLRRELFRPGAKH